MYILGLAIATSYHHAAALISGDELIGAVEEERFNRVKYYGYRHPGDRSANLINSPDLSIRDVLCSHSIRFLLEKARKRLEEIDYIAINGIPYKFNRNYSADNQAEFPSIIQSGKHIFIPHHLAHAASAVRTAGSVKRGYAFTADGRGERETACLFRIEDDDIHCEDFILYGTDSSIGGGYETVTRLLGFGPNGQGITMALAPYGSSLADTRECYTINDFNNYRLSDSKIFDQYGKYQREEGQEILPLHKDIAYTFQDALEKNTLNLLNTKICRSTEFLALAGGVHLNCMLNMKIRDALEPRNMFIQPAAHDAGTALGAALEAYHYITGASPGITMKHAFWGPSYTDDEIRYVLELNSVPYRYYNDITVPVAEQLTRDKIVCWFQGAMEFGPRALGNRSILCSVSSAGLKSRLNRMKGRDEWRPFGPSILEGYEEKYFSNGFHSPFMLFTMNIKEEFRDPLAAVCHVDGTTRPQSVSREYHKKYYDLISKVNEITGLPMVLNTSFNSRGEPIVCSPVDALACFRALKADYLAIGNFLVESS
ncbi:MAG: hypothetical protein GY754_19490 [bacterium]|nr:hypothetical protein [bacterium]